MDAPANGSARPAARSRRPDSIGRNVARVAKLEADQINGRTVTERIAGAVTRAAGTAAFAIIHLVWFAGWIILNGALIRGIEPFDPFPFSLLTMIVSLEAIFLSIWILIRQNQMSRQADRREHLDLQINLLAEQESTATLRIVRRIAEHLGVDLAGCAADDALTRETNIEGVATAVDAALPEPAATSSPILPPPPLRS
jgi:uncharacterized membrane protein